MGTTGEVSWASPNEVKQEECVAWIRTTDPDSGDPYYYNPKTGEVTWDVPTPSEAEVVALKARKSNQLRVPSEDCSATTLKDGRSDEKTTAAKDVVQPSWLPVVDPASGDTYYYHTVTGEVTWDNPEAQEEKPKKSDGRTQKSATSMSSCERKDKYKKKKDQCGTPLSEKKDKKERKDRR